MQRNSYKWLDRTEYPFRHNFFRLDDALMHYVDEGHGQPIVFVHGTPGWSFEFRKIILHFSKTHRCIAPDHIGFGLSDKPAQYNYDIRVHCNNLEAFINSLNLSNITLVVHDFGGPIGITYALRNPTRVNRIVVMNSWLWDFSAEPAFRSFRRFLDSPLLPILYKRLNFSARVMMPMSFGEKNLSGRLRKQFTKPFRNPSERLGCVAFAKSLGKDQQWFEHLWERTHRLSDIPFTFIWGMKDKFVSESFLTKFQTGFPGSTTVKLPGCGHFPQEEEPQAVIDAIERSLGRDAKQEYTSVDSTIRSE
jgi:pimeloyl-ACP methyl ester carboxylesterase